MDPIDPSEIPLRDIHLPEAISWWPLATGWWLSLVFILVASLCAWYYFHHKKHNHKQKILSSLQQIEEQFASDQDSHHLAKQLSILARQITLLQGNEHTPAKRASVGKEWTSVWQQQLEGQALTAEELHRALSIAPYRESEQIDGEKLIAAFKNSLVNKSSILHAGRS